jgi:hypothetical protein
VQGGASPRRRSNRSLLQLSGPPPNPPGLSSSGGPRLGSVVRVISRQCPHAGLRASRPERVFSLFERKATATISLYEAPGRHLLPRCCRLGAIPLPARGWTSAGGSPRRSVVARPCLLRRPVRALRQEPCGRISRLDLLWRLEEAHLTTAATETGIVRGPCGRHGERRRAAACGWKPAFLKRSVSFGVISSWIWCHWHRIHAQSERLDDSTLTATVPFICDV